MKNIINKISAYIIILAIVSIVLGLLLIIFPETTTLTLVRVLGIYLAIAGALGLLSYFRQKGAKSFAQGDLIGGIFELILALIIFIFPQAVAGVFAVLLGILVVLNGVLNMVRALEIKRNGEGKWSVVFILNIVVTIGGILIIINPFSSAVTFVLMMGILLLAKGVVDLVTYLMFLGSVKRLAREAKKGTPE